MGYKKIITSGILLIIFVGLKGQIAFFTADTIRGCETLTVQFTDQSTDATSWFWDFGDGNTSSRRNPQHTYTDSGVFNVSLLINNTISYTEDSLIIIIPRPNPSFYFSDTLEFGSRNVVFRNVRQLYPQRIKYNYLWDFGDGNVGEGRTILHQFSDTGKFSVELTVRVQNMPSCQASASNEVVVRDDVVVPNVFTPNGDNINDLFIVQYNDTETMEFTVFNRYGSLIFKNNAPVIVWDGRNLSGIRVNTGVYFYVLTSADGAINTNGFIHVFSD